MSTEVAATAEGNTQRGVLSFAWMRLGSFIGILPLGVWTVIHVWHNLQAFSGGDAWQAAVTGHTQPIAHAFVLLIVLVPLVIHTIWGIQRGVMTRPNYPSYPYYTNLKYLVQRLTALGAVLFLGAHLWLAMLQPRLVEGHAELFSDIAGEMHNHLPTLAVYLLGTLAICYHLANGISGFSWTWGLMSGRKSFRIMDRVSIIVFLVLTAICWSAIYALYSAGGAAA